MSNPLRDMCAELLAIIPASGTGNPNSLVVARARTLLGTADQTRRYIYNPVQIAECGGPCEQGPEHCDCGALWDDGNPAPQPEPPLPISAHDLAARWNQQANADDQWESLDLYEQLAWAQSRAIAADRARRAQPDTAFTRSVPEDSITILTSTLEQVLGALEAGLEAAEGEHSDAVIRDWERRPLRVKWYAEQVELIAAAINDLRLETGRTTPLVTS